MLLPFSRRSIGPVNALPACFQKEPTSMSDIDAVSNLLERLAEFEVELNRVRDGKKPAASLDLLTWTAGTSFPATEGKSTGPSTRPLDTIRQTLREDWNGLREAVAAGAARIDERFAR
jgi:hypothetical protein